MGYPDCDLLRQASAIITAWAEKSVFPVTFLACQGFQDSTSEQIEKLCSLTEVVREVFGLIDTCQYGEAQQLLKELLVSMEFRGFTTIFGLRTTTGSQEEPWPLMNTILDAFKKPHTLPTPEMLAKGRKPSKLTVGARALTKHSHRSSEGFWGRNTGSEDHKNGEAERIIN